MNKELIKKAVRMYLDNHPNQKLQYPEWDGVDCHDAFIAGAEWMSNQSQWISVDDRTVAIPLDDDVLIRFENGSIRKYDEDWEKEFGLDAIVTHWMPIPHFNNE